MLYADYVREKIRTTGKLKCETWADIQKIVRRGKASSMFCIGQQLTCNHSGYGNLVWDIIGFDHDVPTDSNYTHSMTLQLHDCLPNGLLFDTREATWYIDADNYPSGLSAGTYNFTLPVGYDTAYGGGQTYNFTLTTGLPVGGQIMFDWREYTQALNCYVFAYASALSKTTTEITTISLGAVGTALTDLDVFYPTSNANCIQRTRYGSNNWNKSYVRQWLNATANNWWQPQTVFDRPANADPNGFLAGMDSEFLDVIGTVTKQTQKSISDGYGMDTSTERFFLLSRPEVYGGTQRPEDGADGTVYAYYGAGRSALSAPGVGVDSNRIKYKSGSAATWLLRTPLPRSGGACCMIFNSGNLDYIALSGYENIAPACVII